MSAVLIADKLRASLLQAAIQGKLTKQLPEDGDARDLLKEIEAEKARLIEEKVIRKEKPLPPITEDEIPFEIPENWVWVRLGDLANKIHYGYTASAQDVGEIRLLRITDIQNNSVDWNAVPFCFPTDREKEAYLLTNNDIVIARTGGTIGKSFKISKLLGEAVFASYLIRVVPTLGALASYIDHYLDTPIYWEQLSNNTMGTGQPNVNATALKGLFIPLPPLAEQYRIVEAIETALAKIDKLKTDEDKLYDIQKAFPNKLRASLLQSAIQGQLTEQLPEDGDARDLLKEIEAEKARLIEEKVIRKEKPLPPITEDEIPFEIPENWVWVRIGEVTIINPKNKIDDELDVGFIPMAHISDGYRNEFIYDVKKWKDIKKGFTHFANNDLVIAKITPCFQNRKSAVLQGLPNGFGAGTTELHVIRVIENLVNPLYLLYLSKSNAFINSGVANFTGTAGQQRIGKDFVSQYLLPLPPLAEQERIVKKLDEILGKVDELNKVAE